MKLFKYAPSCDLSPLPESKCPWCTNDGTLCEFDTCPLDVSDDAEKAADLRDQLIKELKGENKHNENSDR